MAEPRRTVTYEVQALRGSRWEIHARFDEKGRHVALTRARAMNRHPRVSAVRVVKEIYDPEQGAAQEFIIYKSHSTGASAQPRSRVKVRRRRLRRRLGRWLTPPIPVGEVAASLIKAIATSPQWAMLPRALLGTMVAFGAAVVVTGMTAYMLGSGRSTAAAPPSSSDVATLLVIFAGIFLFGAVLVGFLLSAAPTRRDLQPPARKPAPPPPARKVVAPTVATTTPAKIETAPPLPHNAEALRNEIVAYLRQAVQPARGAYDLKDSYIRFGINLFVAGACEALCQQHNIEPSTASVIMAAGLRAVGVDADHAATLAENYVEYLVSDGRYMAMFGRGRDAIAAHLAGRADAVDLLLRALDEWTQARPSQNERNLVTIMFTCMTGFEELIAAQGDEAARQAISNHNEIIDRRLIEFNGKRIKHIHDGTMAAFMAAADAARAAHAIRADFTERSTQGAVASVGLSIGLNCGEPIAEGNDLFGASVQLAARIVGTAKPGQILVSEAVRERLLTEAPTITFAVCGPFSLKGFGDPVPLYELTGI